MDLRIITGDDLRVLRALWGHNALNAAVANSYVCNGAWNSRPAALWTDDGACVIYCDPMFGIASLAHEIGHAIHYAMYPESRTSWGEEKCETFALLATANACRSALRLGFIQLTDEERSVFAFHAWGTRASGPVYRRALAEAHRIAKSPFLSRQITEAACGRPN